MNLLADEGVDQSIVMRLRADGHDVSYAAETSRGADDELILDLANESDRILLTADSDFGELVFRQGLAHKGVIIALEGLSAELKSELVSMAIGEHGEELESAFTVISPGTIRIRRRQ